MRDRLPARHRERFEETARESRDVAFGFVAGNVVTSACAGAYVYAVLTVLGVPAPLLLSVSVATVYPTIERVWLRRARISQENPARG